MQLVLCASNFRKAYPCSHQPTTPFWLTVKITYGFIYSRRLGRVLSINETFYLKAMPASDELLLDSNDPRAANSLNLSRGEQWLGSLTANVAATGLQRRPVLQASGRSQSLGSPDAAAPKNPPTSSSPSALPAIPPRSSPFHVAQNPSSAAFPTGGNNRTNPNTAADPFDAEWAALATRSPNSTNPFLQNSVVKTFEVRM